MKSKNIIVLGVTGAGLTLAMDFVRAMAIEQTVVFVAEEKENVEEILIRDSTVLEITRCDLPDFDIIIEPKVVPFSKFREKKYSHKHISKRNYNHRRR